MFLNRFLAAPTGLMPELKQELEQTRQAHIQPLEADKLELEREKDAFKQEKTEFVQ